MKVGTNDFVRRQTDSSEFAHFDGSFEDLCRLVERHIDNAEPGYRDGVLLVPVPADDFFTSFVEVTEDTELVADVTRRREDEEPYIRVRAIGDKSPAKAVKIVIYAHSVLEEDGDASTDAEYEIVSINATPCPEEIPMDPVTMARNHLHRDGGTQGTFTADEFANAIWAHQKWVPVLVR